MKPGRAMNISSRLILTCLASLCCAASPAADTGPQEPLTVFAAASLTDVLQKVGNLYTQATSTPVKMSFAASSALARQIESGARAQVFLSADQDWMDYLQARGLIDPTSRQDLLGNELVLIAPGDTKPTIRLDTGSAARTALLATLGPRGRLSVAEPDAVPAGKYAMEALHALGLKNAVQSRLVRADNVRVALMYVARSEAPLGIVYATDAAAEPRVRVVDVFPASSHKPITYPVAATTGAATPSRPFIEFLRSQAARVVFIEAGFTIIEPAPIE